MSDVAIVALLLTLAALVAYSNDHFLRLPSAIGMMVSGLILSLVLYALSQVPLLFALKLVTIAQHLDFSKIVMQGFLAFLLFAGAMNLDIPTLRRYQWPVVNLSLLTTGLVTLIAGLLYWATARTLGFDIPVGASLLFGAIIAPTDPIAALGIVRRAGVQKDVETMVVAESLFNDGVGLVLFLTLLPIAVHDARPDFASVLVRLLVTPLGGAGLGLVVGWMGNQLLKGLDHYPSEILVTLAVALGSYSAANALDISGPIATVVAGMVVGNYGRTHSMSDVSRAHLDTFWELIDQIFNALLFLLMGLVVLRLHVVSPDWVMSAITVGTVLLARWISVATAIVPLSKKYHLPRGTTRLLTWGGLHGGLSLAMALSIPASPYRSLLLTTVYTVVIFSVLVQGLTIGAVAKLLKPPTG